MLRDILVSEGCEKAIIAMEKEQFLCFAMCYFVAVVFFTLVSAGRRSYSLVIAACGLLGVIVVTFIASPLVPGSTFVGSLVHQVLVSRYSKVAALFGFALGASFICLGRVKGEAGEVLPKKVLWVVLPLSQLIAIGCVALIWNRASRPPAKFVASVVDHRFEVADVLEVTEGRPLRITADEVGNVFLSVQVNLDEGVAGTIFKLLIPESGQGRFGLQAVASSPLLYRPFGLAARNGKLYVSHSGLLGHAKNGRIEYENAGSVTELSDLDEDGTYELYHDVVTGLPGSQGPDSQHQNNGIAFGPDGSLFITQGVSSNRHVPNQEHEGAILRATQGFSSVEVFARGFRNPFGITVLSGGQVLSTDNDSNADAGDEVNLIEPGKHYGHPYVVGGDDGGGDFTCPLVIGKSGGNFCGITNLSGASLPAEFQGCVLIVDLKRGALEYGRLNSDGENRSLSLALLANLPVPLDVAATPEGAIYVLSRNNHLFQIRCVRQ